MTEDKPTSRGAEQQERMQRLLTLIARMEANGTSTESAYGYLNMMQELLVFMDADIERPLGDVH